MVASIFVRMDGFVGSGYAASKENTKNFTTHCVYDRMRGAWFLVWNVICSGTSAALRHAVSGDDCLDYCGVAMGLYTRYQ